MSRSVFRRTKGISEPQTIYPHREWLIGIGLLVVIVCVAGVLSVRDFLYYDTIQDRVTAEVIPVVPYTSATAEKAIAIFSVKEAQFKLLSGRPPAPVAVPEQVATSTAGSFESETIDASQEDETEEQNNEDVPVLTPDQDFN